VNIVFQVGIFWGFATIFQFCGVDVTHNVGNTWTFNAILRPVKNGVNVLIKKSRISVL
jgi:hypothetical protein